MLRHHKMAAALLATSCIFAVALPASAKLYARKMEIARDASAPAIRGWVFNARTVQISHAWYDTFGSSNVTLWAWNGSNSNYFGEIGYHAGDAFSPVYGPTQDDNMRFYMGFSDTGAGDITLLPQTLAIGSDHTYYIYKDDNDPRLVFNLDNQYAYYYNDNDAQHMSIKYARLGLEANNSDVTFSPNEIRINWHQAINWDWSYSWPSYYQGWENDSPFFAGSHNWGWGNGYGLKIIK